MTATTDICAPAEPAAVGVYQAIGGPERYRGPGLARAHAGLGISDADFDAAAGHLAATLGSLGAPGHLAGHIAGIVAGLRPAVVTA